MDWKLYEENKKNKDRSEMYRTFCKILGVIILALAVLCYTTDNNRIKVIEELKGQISEQEEKIKELEDYIKYLQEEARE